MPHKLGFTVVSSSGHEDGFSAKELMVHAPTVNGWRSPRYCGGRNVRSSEALSLKRVGGVPCVLRVVYSIPDQTDYKTKKVSLIPWNPCPGGKKCSGYHLEASHSI